MSRRYYHKQGTKNIDENETEANNAISRLISSIGILVARKDPLIRTIKSPKLLIRGLTELQDMVEMVDIKHSIVNQIQFLIANHARKQINTPSTNEKAVIGSPVLTSLTHSSHFEGHMLHSVISGNPGTGKTTVGMILAKIWMALGFVNKKETKETKEPIETPSAPILLANTIINTVNESYRKRVRELEENDRNERRRLDRVRELLSRYHTTSGEIRRKAIKLRPHPSKNFDTVDIDKEWDTFLTLTRELRFGFDEVIREVNIRSTGSTGISGTNEESDPYENIDPKFIVAAREDFIAEYLGQTAPKTKKLLESARGGVLFIDEAYSLCNMDGGSKDKYGEECLTTINEFMSLYPDEIIIIFAGYKDKLMSSIFKAQPGLFRRCAWIFEIKDYTHRGLAKIFTQQLARHSWTLAPNINIEEILSENHDIVKDGGGFTEKLALFVKLQYGKAKFTETIESTGGVQHDSIITEPMIKAALIEMRKNVDDRINDDPPFGLFG